MAVRRHNFYLRSSIQQRLSFLVVAALCLSSFLLWPKAYPDIFVWFKALTFVLVVVVLGRAFLRLVRWQVDLSLDEEGEYWLLNGSECELVRSYVMPLMCLVYLKVDGQERLVMVFKDMLNEADYRALCRVLLRHQKGSHEAP